jgi:predicted ferric reductase
MGTMAAFFLFLQLVLSARLQFLDRIFSINRLMSQHRIHGIIIGVLALLHVLFIRTSLGPEVFYLDVRQWPEYVGGLVLLMILGSVSFSLLRRVMGLAYEKWCFFHRLAAPVTVGLLGLHVFFVSDTFDHGLARNTLQGAFSAYALLFIGIRIRNVWIRKTAYRIESVSVAGEGSYRVELKSDGGRELKYRPGQFAFLRFKSTRIPGEEHPFTISSTPTRPSMLEFTIRASGDWTKKIKDLQKMDRAYVHGPFGLYGLLDISSLNEIVMIAGGIGITPMLSILRYLSDTMDRRRILLIWSNRTQKQVVYPDEFQELENALPGLEIIQVLTREPGYEGETGRLEKEKLKRLLDGQSRDSVVLVCGPPQMMLAVKDALLDLGFPRGSVYMERFEI